MFSSSAACAPSLASSSSLCPFPLWWTGHISTKPKMHHSSTFIKNDHQLWPIKKHFKSFFLAATRGHEIELTWGKFHYLESWTKAKIGTLMVSRYLMCAPNSRLFQITQNEFYSCILPSDWIKTKLFAFLLYCWGKCRFIQNLNIPLRLFTECVKMNHEHLCISSNDKSQHSALTFSDLLSKSWIKSNCPSWKILSIPSTEYLDHSCPSQYLWYCYIQANW